jgi:hypothetical protein
MATAMVAGNGVAAVASTSEIVGREAVWSSRSAGKRGLRVRQRVVVAALKGGIGSCEEERRAFLSGGGRGPWLAGEWSVGSVAGRRSRRGGRLVVRMAADYYGVLGVPKSATKQDIKSAYRKLARKVSGFSL